MNKNIEGLNPQRLWYHFSQILKSPHPSNHEEAIREYIINFATSQGLEYEVDSEDNIYIRKAATPGMERCQGIIVQSHVDMVPQKSLGSDFDFEKDAIQAYIDGEWVKADGTTLGADNGIGVAAMLALLEDNTIKHGAIEALFTATEEVGLRGAMGIKRGALKGDILLNLDSEREGELCVGCAGGVDLTAEFELELLPTPKKGYQACRIDVSGLKGGHSGVDIVLQRGNANKILFRLLRSSDLDLQLSSVDGGGLRNAIPREASAVVVLPCEDVDVLRDEVALFQQVINREYVDIEDYISVTISDVEMPKKMIDEDISSCIVWAIAACFDGVAKFSTTMHGLVQSSSNLARVVSKGDTLTVKALLRSSSQSEKDALAQQITSTFELADADVTLSSDYDGWSPNLDSEILSSMKTYYKELFGVEPHIKAIHAGLECGVILAKYPKLDMISFGPTILYPHSPDERVDIESVEKFYKLLLHTVENVATK
ncbi:MAG: aminoacyl-histidine dipeptidase [Rikenellaceae bacterium]